MEKQKVRQAVIFPGDSELARLRRENNLMMNTLKAIKSKELFPHDTLVLYEYQSCLNLADETIDAIEGD